MGLASAEKAWEPTYGRPAAHLQCMHAECRGAPRWHCLWELPGPRITPLNVKPGESVKVCRVTPEGVRDMPGAILCSKEFGLPAPGIMWNILLPPQEVVWVTEAWAASPFLKFSPELM